MKGWIEHTSTSTEQLTSFEALTVVAGVILYMACFVGFPACCPYPAYVTTFDKVERVSQTVSLKYWLPSWAKSEIWVTGIYFCCTIFKAFCLHWSLQVRSYLVFLPLPVFHWQATIMGPVSIFQTWNSIYKLNFKLFSNSFSFLFRMTVLIRVGCSSWRFTSQQIIPSNHLRWVSCLHPNSAGVVSALVNKSYMKECPYLTGCIYNKNLPSKYQQ